LITYSIKLTLINTITIVCDKIAYDWKLTDYSLKITYVHTKNCVNPCQGSEGVMGATSKKGVRGVVMISY